MQNTYFLGGASPEGFATSFYAAHREYFGYFLKGGPGTGKSTLMKRIAAAFPEEDVSVITALPIRSRWMRSCWSSAACTWSMRPRPMRPIRRCRM